MTPPRKKSKEGDGAKPSPASAAAQKRAKQQTRGPGGTFGPKKPIDTPAPPPTTEELQQQVGQQQEEPADALAQLAEAQAQLAQQHGQLVNAQLNSGKKDAKLASRDVEVTKLQEQLKEVQTSRGGQKAGRKIAERERDAAKKEAGAAKKTAEEENAKRMEATRSFVANRADWEKYAAAWETYARHLEGERDVLKEQAMEAGKRIEELEDRVAEWLSSVHDHESEQHHLPGPIESVWDKIRECLRADPTFKAPYDAKSFSNTFPPDTVALMHEIAELGGGKTTFAKHKSIHQAIIIIYLLVSLHSRKATFFKAEISELLRANRAPTRLFDLLARFGFALGSSTIKRIEAKIVREHQAYVEKQLGDDLKKYMLIFNLDDYHNIHNPPIPRKTQVQPKTEAVHIQSTVFFMTQHHAVARPSPDSPIVRSVLDLDDMLKYLNDRRILLLNKPILDAYPILLDEPIQSATTLTHSYDVNDMAERNALDERDASAGIKVTVDHASLALVEQVVSGAVGGEGGGADGGEASASASASAQAGRAAGREAGREVGRGQGSEAGGAVGSGAGASSGMGGAGAGHSGRDDKGKKKAVGSKVSGAGVEQQKDGSGRKLEAVGPIEQAIQQTRTSRAANSATIVSILQGSLHNAKDYCASLASTLELASFRTHAQSFVIPASLDNPGVSAFRRSIRLLREFRVKFPDSDHPWIPAEVEALWPTIGPLHLSLNMRETAFDQHGAFFRLFNRMLSGKELRKSPTPQAIAYLTTVMAKGWRSVRSVVLDAYARAPPEVKIEPHVQYLLGVLENDVQAAFSVYEQAQRAGKYDEFVGLTYRLCELAWKWDRRNYKFRILELLSDLAYLERTHPALIDAIKSELASVSDYFVENVHSRIRCRTTATSNADEIARRAYTTERSDDSALVAAARALGSTEQRRANREKRFDVAVAGAEAVLLELWLRMLGVGGRDTDGEPFAPLPMPPPPPSKEKGKGKGKGKGKAAGTAPQAPATAAPESSGSGRRESSGSGAGEASASGAVSSELGAGRLLSEGISVPAGSVADAAEGGDAMDVDPSGIGQSAAPSADRGRVEGGDGPAGEVPVATVAGTGKGFPGKAGTDWVWLGKLRIEVRLRAMPLAYHHTHKEGNQLCPKDGYSPFSSVCWCCSPPSVDPFPPPPELTRGRGRGSRSGRGGSRSSSSGRDPAQGGRGRGGGSEDASGQGANAEHLPAQKEEKKKVTLVVYSGDWVPTSTQATFAEFCIAHESAEGEEGVEDEERVAGNVIVVARCSHWYHQRCFEGMRSVCTRCEKLVVDGWIKTKDALEENLCKAVSEHFEDVDKPVSGSEGEDGVTGGETGDGDGEEGADGERDVDTAIFKNVGEQLLPSGEDIAAKGDDLHQRFASKAATRKAALASSFL